MIRKAATLTPKHPSSYHISIAWHHWASDEYETALAEAKKIEMPHYFWAYVVLALAYGAMDRKEGRVAVEKVIELYPDFPRNVRAEARKWNFPDSVIDREIRDLRRAGIDIPAGT
jgi:hypothetical protein